MKLKLFQPFLFIVLLFFIKYSNAQSCLENLITANKLLNAGNADGCLALVNDCSHPGNQESVRWQAYRLMSIAYGLKGYQDSARRAAENMLDINPTYKPNPRLDPGEFVNLTRRIVVIPKFTLGIAFSLGANLTLPQITQGYVAAEYLKTYTSKNSFQFGTHIGFYLTPKLALGLSFLATLKKYNINYSIANIEISIQQRFTYLDIPLTVKYILPSNKPLRLFVELGGFAGYLLYSENDFQSSQHWPEEEFSLPRLNSIDRYNRLNYGLTGGIGAYYKINQGQLSLQLNYFYSLANVVKAEGRYNYSELLYTYYYIDDDIRLHNATLSIGYSRFLNYKVYRKK